MSINSESFLGFSFFKTLWMVFDSFRKTDSVCVVVGSAVSKSKDLAGEITIFMFWNLISKIQNHTHEF
ncbi:hypothetical protein D3C86_1121670 [compost metagenome]